MSGVPHAPDPAIDVLRAVDEVDWFAYSMPPSQQWYRPRSVPKAFRLLVAVSNQEQGWAAYNAMLFAVGNNHAGCLYPAAVPAAPLLTRVVRELHGWPRWAALEILIDYLAFDVDRVRFTDPTGSVIETKEAILAAVRNIHEDLERLTKEPAAAPIAKSARDLLEQLDEQTSAG
jgi:hypothetical protein